MKPNLETTIEAARKHLPEYEKIIQEVTYENKGILFSEMLFIYACKFSAVPLQILESGRARAQSTLILSLGFPESTIVSIERYRDTEDAAIAAERLKNRTNVASLFGDSTRILPHLVLPGDIVLIDGPKRFRALIFAMDMLATGKVKAVFVHDVSSIMPERLWLEKNVKGVFFSDHPDYVKQFGHLDKPCWDTISEREVGGWRPFEYGGVKCSSYGPTLACIPYDPSVSYGLLKLKLILAKLEYKLGKLLGKTK